MQENTAQDGGLLPARSPGGVYAGHQPDIISIPPGPLKMWYLREDEVDRLSSSAFGAVSLAICTLMIGLCSGFVIVLQTVSPLTDRQFAAFLALSFASGFVAILSGAFAVIDLVRVESAKAAIRKRGVTR